MTERAKAPPRRERRKPDKPPMPANLRPLADAAIERHRARTVPPKVQFEGDEFGLLLASPYADKDEDGWQALLFQALGTRSIAVARCFLTQLAALCGRTWDDRAKQWKPVQDEFDAILAICNALKPRNEAQAAYAAQLCAVHLAGMRLGKMVAGVEYPDARTAAILNKTVRTYGDGLETMARLQGKGRRSKQTIEVHHHEHKHVHFENRGDDENGGRPHATDGAAIIEGCATVPGGDALGLSLSSRGGAEQACLPDARRGQGKRRPNGRG